AAGTRDALFGITCLVLAAALTMCHAIVTSKFGKVLVAIRDAEARARFLGYKVESYKLVVFTLSACIAGVAGALYVPQVGIINPSEFAPANSIEEVIWVAVGGRGTLTGAILGAVVVNYGKTYFTSGALAPYWLFVLGGLFVGVTLLLPRGIVGTVRHLLENRRKPEMPDPDPRPAGAPAPAEGHCDACTRDLRALVSRRCLCLVRRLSGAQRAVVHDRCGRNARHHRSQRRRQDHDDGCRDRQDAASEGRRAVRRHPSADRAR